MARDLHKLASDEGLLGAARAMGRSTRSTRDVRSGATPLTVDDLYQLRLTYPDFDVEATVMRIGAKRAARR
jgi:hypothetical protein